MTDEQVESDMRALLAIAKPRAREALAEKIAARVDELFKGFDSEGAGYTGAAVPRKASLKPDHMKPRRPIQPVVVVPPAVCASPRCCCR